MRKSLKKTKGVVNSSQRSILSFMVSTQILNYGRSFIGILNIIGNCEQDSENLDVVVSKTLDFFTRIQKPKHPTWWWWWWW